MLRLAIDHKRGTGRIPCPRCGSPLLLATYKMGRWLVGYKDGIRLRPGKPAWLICPAYECEYQEEVSIVSDRRDAVLYDPISAAWKFRQAVNEHHRTLGEMLGEMKHLAALHARTGSVKLPSAIRFWRDRASMLYWDLRRTLEGSLADGSAVICKARDWRHEGRVTAFSSETFLLETADGTLHLHLTDLLYAEKVFPWEIPYETPLPFDFGGQGTLGKGVSYHKEKYRLAVIAGHTLRLSVITDAGRAFVSTEDPETARSLDLWSPDGHRYEGEFPAGLIDQVYVVFYYGHVQGFRLLLVRREEGTLILETRKIEVARALSMNRYGSHFKPLFPRLAWWKAFSPEEVRVEEVRIPVRLPRFVRARR